MGVMVATDRLVHLGTASDLIQTAKDLLAASGEQELVVECGALLRSIRETADDALVANGG